MVLSVDGLYMNKINCGKSYLDADKPNVSYMDVIILEPVML